MTFCGVVWGRRLLSSVVLTPAIGRFNASACKEIHAVGLIGHCSCCACSQAALNCLTFAADGASFGCWPVSVICACSITQLANGSALPHCLAGLQPFIWVIHPAQLQGHVLQFVLFVTLPSTSSHSAIQQGTMLLQTGRSAGPSLRACIWQSLMV